MALIGVECGRCASRRRMAQQIERLEGEAAGVDATGLADDLMDLHNLCPNCHGTGRTPGVLRELVKREPVEFVEVTDRNPHPDAHNPLTHCGWIRFDGEDRPDELPHDVYDALEGGSQQHDAVEWLHYPTANAARAALSAAILRLVQPVENRAR